MHFSKETGQCGVLILPGEQSSSALRACGTPAVVTIVCGAADMHTRHFSYSLQCQCARFQPAHGNAYINTCAHI